MKIDGSTLAAQIYRDLNPRIAALAKKNITPHVGVILVGDDQASEAYVSQKQRRAEEHGIHVSLFQYDAAIDTKTLLEKVNILNVDESIHGIIIQRPLPNHINTQQITEQTNPQKDVDSFRANAPFDPPLPAAIITILESIFMQYVDRTDTFHTWLINCQIVVIGKGETAGAPITSYLTKLGCYPTVIDSKTEHKNNILQQADIVISAVGREGVVTGESLKPGVILIGVGLHRNELGQLSGDYNESDIEKVAAFYTPNPGGVGPVNVAMLLKNVVLAAEKQQKV